MRMKFNSYFLKWQKWPQKEKKRLVESLEKKSVKGSWKSEATPSVKNPSKYSTRASTKSVNSSTTREPSRISALHQKGRTTKKSPRTINHPKRSSKNEQRFLREPPTFNIENRPKNPKSHFQNE